MPFTLLSNPVTNTPVSTSGFGDPVVADINYLANMDRWQVTTVNSTTNNFATSGTPLVVAWEVETYDPFALHGTGANDTKVIIAQAGLYEITACLSYAANATGSRDVWISKGASGTTPGTSTANAVAVGRNGAFASAVAPVMIEREIQCAVGDVMWVVGSQSSGGALALGTSAWMNFFSGRWVASS